MNIRFAHDARNHVHNGETRKGVDPVAANSGRNGMYTLDVGAVMVSALRRLGARYRGRLNVRCICQNVAVRRAGHTSVLDYNRAVANALADLESQGCVRIIGDLWVDGDTERVNMNARVKLTNLM